MRMGKRRGRLRMGKMKMGGRMMMMGRRMERMRTLTKSDRLAGDSHSSREASTQRLDWQQQRRREQRGQLILIAY